MRHLVYTDVIMLALTKFNDPSFCLGALGPNRIQTWAHTLPPCMYNTLIRYNLSSVVQPKHKLSPPLGVSFLPEPVRVYFVVCWPIINCSTKSKTPSPVLLALAFLSTALNSSAEIFLSLELTVSCIKWALMAEFRIFSSLLDLLAVSNLWMTC